jgi:hypothetical protein
MCVDVLARSMCALSIVYVLFLLSLDVAYVFPFIASQERARITFVVKRCKWERMKEKNKKKSGLRCGRLRPYPVGTVFL